MKSKISITVDEATLLKILENKAKHRCSSKSELIEKALADFLEAENEG